MVRPRVFVRPPLLTTLALSLALTTSCKSKTDEPASTSDSDASKVETPDATPDPAQPEAVQDPAAAPVDEPEDPRAAAIAITQAKAAASSKGKGVKGLGFNIEKISHLFALMATAKLPEWGAAGAGEAKLTRDDDLDTAWTCEFGQDKPCVLGLALPEKAKVEVVRLYTAGGPRYRDYKGYPRVAKVRVHTDAGFVEASVADGADHTYVRFDAPIETQSLAIEVLELHAGNYPVTGPDAKGKQILLAEVEVYGTDGVARPPLSLDPSLAWVGWETTAWGGNDLDHTIRQDFIYFARPGEAGEDGPPRRRFGRATAVFGQLGDDYALIERLHGTSCDSSSGNYMLLDKRNRMSYALGELGGAGAQVYRHAAGHGFAVGWMNDEGQFTIKGIVEEGGKLKWKRPPKDGAEDGAAQLRAWGFEPEPLPRGVALDGAVAGCHRGGAGELAPVIAAARLSAADQLDPAQWMICSVGAETLYASAPCDAKARAYQLDASGKIIGKHENKLPDARGFRLRRSGDKLFVELSSKQGDTASLYLAEPGAFTRLEANGALFVRPPKSCAPCEDAWINPEAPFTDDEGEGADMDEGFEGDEDYRDEGEEPEPEPEPEPEDEDEAQDAPADARPLPPPSPAPPSPG